jgi:hypothetical protein
MQSRAYRSTLENAGEVSADMPEDAVDDSV